ncbi:MAG: HAD-IA family hydrolase [Spirochaetes bacterium]|nr:HAD-IA family hydrolase [Spirochaetota bacterium]
MIRRLIFDLDSTLYPSASGMEAEIIRRMNEFTAGLLDMGKGEAAELRRTRMPRYGTTLEWLMVEHGFRDVEGYYAAIHPAGEEDILVPDPGLRPFLDSLGLPMSVFTNAPSEHADRVIERLGLSGVFDSVFDIRFCGLRGKPYTEAFRKVCAALGNAPEDCVFVDDVPRYVRGFVACGGHGVLIDDQGKHAAADMPRIVSLYELKPMLDGGFFAWRQLSMFQAPAPAPEAGGGMHR